MSQRAGQNAGSMGWRFVTGMSLLPPVYPASSNHDSSQSVPLGEARIVNEDLLVGVCTVWE
jgi:hypothetical protein